MSLLLYSAINKMTREIVAMKKIKDKSEGGHVVTRASLREMHLLEELQSQLQHPNIVRLLV